MKLDKDNILHWAQEYDDSYKEKYKNIEKRLKKLLSEQRYLTQDDLYRIMVWKAPRIKRYAKENKPDMIEKITQESFKTEDEQIKIESLIGQKGGLKGVGYPVASTILHFAFPEKYPILDFRVLESLSLLESFNWKKPSSYNFKFWWKYCMKIRDIAHNCNLDIRTVDKALWQYSKEQKPNSTCCR